MFFSFYISQNSTGSLLIPHMDVEIFVGSINSRNVTKPLADVSLNLFTTTGALFGLGLGVILLQQTKRFVAEGPIWKRIVRYLAGLVGVLVLYLGLGKIFPDDISYVSFALRFVRYLLIGFWISYGAPQVFYWLKLISPTTN